MSVVRKWRDAAHLLPGEGPFIQLRNARASDADKVCPRAEFRGGAGFRNHPFFCSPSSIASLSSLDKKPLCGQFRLESRLATGGMAEVYLARDEHPLAKGRLVVVKRLRRNVAEDPSARMMFDREAALHAVVKHDNVVTVFGSGKADDGEPYLAMEFVDGVDCHRLLARTSEAHERLPIEVCVYIARDVLSALASVHGATDERGQLLGIIHRDVTPSNIYLSKDGRVKLGDFGIARSTGRATIEDAEGALPKGKFAYLSPEQIAAQPFDHRADLFSTATVLAELIMGKRLFAGNGHLAILLAIQECKLEALHEAKSDMPKELFAVLLKGLSRDPADRFQSAMSFSLALRPFAGDLARARAEVVRLVGRAYISPRENKAPIVIRDSAATMRAVKSGMLPGARREMQSRLELDFRELPHPPDDDDGPATSRNRDDSEDTRTVRIGRDDDETTQKVAASPPSFVETTEGTRLGPWSFSRLVEALMTGEVTHDDRVRFGGRKPVRAAQIRELARFLPARPSIAREGDGLAPSDFRSALTSSAMVGTLLRILREHATGMLVASRPDGEPAERKEIYFVDGRLHHAISSNIRELFGQWLLRRGLLSKENLQRALIALPAYNGRIGDALIGLEIMSAVDTLHALREQASDRVASVFAWKAGTLSFYRGIHAKDVELPLDVDVPRLALLGMSTARTDAATLEEYRTRLDHVIALVSSPPAVLDDVARPSSVRRVLAELREPRSLRDVVFGLELTGEVTAGDALHAVELLAAARCILVVS